MLKLGYDFSLVNVKPKSKRNNAYITSRVFLHRMKYWFLTLKTFSLNCGWSN